VRIDGPRVLLEPYAAQAIALVLHELATNAAKYGSLSLPDGRISVTWLQEVGRPTVLHWKEMDGPAVQTPTRQGFGARIIERMIGQLEGKARLDWRADGLVCEITLPPWFCHTHLMGRMPAIVLDSGSKMGARSNRSLCDQL
jgi:two-component sensor histidine kinase